MPSPPEPVSTHDRARALAARVDSLIKSPSAAFLPLAARDVIRDMAALLVTITENQK